MCAISRVSRSHESKCSYVNILPTKISCCTCLCPRVGCLARFKAPRKHRGFPVRARPNRALGGLRFGFELPLCFPLAPPGAWPPACYTISGLPMPMRATLSARAPPCQNPLCIHLPLVRGSTWRPFPRCYSLTGPRARTSPISDPQCLHTQRGRGGAATFNGSNDAFDCDRARR